MKNKNLLLLKTLLLSTSQQNIFRYTKDGKKKRRIVGSMIGMVILYAMLIAYSILTGIGYGAYGIADATPVMCALAVSVLAFISAFFRTDGYLFNFKEYDMLMSLPLEEKSIAACRFLYIYIKCLPWYLVISLPMMIVYGYYIRPVPVVYPVWFLLSFLLPIIPMLLAFFLGFLIARVSAGFKKTKIVQTILTIAFVIACFSFRFILEAMFRNDQVESVLQKTSETTARAAAIYLPAGWFADAVTKTKISSILLLIGVSVLLFTVVFRLVGGSYRNINSALKSHAAAGRFKMQAQKVHSVRQAIAFKEYKRMTGSSAYTVQGAMGEILALLLGVLTLIIGFDRIIAIVVQGAPVDPAILRPAIPFILYFFIGMLSTTACSPSLEGKNYWIVRSLPIEKKTLMQGKMLFNLYLTVPVMLLSVFCMSISAHVPVPEMLLYLLLGTTLCVFSTTWGCVCGIRHMRLDWENEIEVVKQSAAVAIYMLPNMFACMGLSVLVVFLGMRMDHMLLMLILIVVTAALAVLCYLRAMVLAKHLTL